MEGKGADAIYIYIYIYTVAGEKLTESLEIAQSTGDVISRQIKRFAGMAG